MDTELCEYLDAMEQRIVKVVQQGDAAIRNEMHQEVAGLREEVVVALHKETRREISTLRGEMQEIGIEVRTLRTDVATEVCALRADMRQMEQRLIENIQGRQEDIDAAFGDIDSLKRAAQSLSGQARDLSGQIQDHERRITILESRGRPVEAER